MLVQEQRAASRENIERKMARTADELAEEEGSDDSELSDGGGEGSDDEDTVPYNPKNLPLGWDGKVHTVTLYTLSHFTHSHSPSPTGCTSYMVLISPTHVKFVVMPSTKDPRTFRDTFQ